MGEDEDGGLYLRDLIAWQAEEWGEKPFLLFEDREYSFAQLDRLSSRLAHGLLEAGGGRGDHVAVMLPNHPDYILSWFALTKSGGAMVPVNTALKGDGLAYILDHSDARLLITDHTRWDRVRDVAGELDDLEQIVLSTDEAPPDYELPAGAVDLETLYAEETSPPNVDLKPDDIVRIMYTSGTTGRPKGVVHNRDGAEGGSGMMELPFEYDPEDTVYTCLPLFHANAMFISTLYAFALGASLGLGRRFSASGFWDDVRHYGATWTSFLGAMVPILYNQPERPDDADNPLKQAISAAAPKEIWRDFEERFDLRLLEFYGAVDGAGLMYNEEGRPGSMGKPLEGCEARVVDEDGEELGPHEVGELWMRRTDESGERTVVYYKDPEATRTKHAGEWVRTGDYVYYDEDGFYYFVDRKKHAIRRRGENISSWEVEQIINRHPHVAESAVFGVPSELGEDDVMAAVVPEQGADLEPLSVVTWCEERMAYFKVPRYVRLMDSLEKTGTHRVQKETLREQGVTETTWDRKAAGYELER